MEKYIDYFSALHTNSQKGVKAPHKAIMLLSVIDLVEYGVITSNQIEFSEHLEGLSIWSRTLPLHKPPLQKGGLGDR